jgi:dihydrofolate reductase
MPTDRPRCSAFIAASLDGFIARPDGRIDWLDIVRADGEDYGFQPFFDAVDVMVVGRRTYDTVLAFDVWPYTGKRCVVLTHRPPPPRHGEEFHAGSPTELVERLAREGAHHLYVDGGEVVAQFLAAGLLDDLTLSVLPILLGAGRPLFALHGPERRLTLEACRSWPTGLAQLRYRIG